MRKTGMVGLAALALLGFACIASAQGGGAGQETLTPAPAESQPAAQPAAIGGLDAGQVKAAVNEYIEKDMRLKGGVFLLYDAADKKVWELRSPKIHEDVLSQDANASVACVDMTAGKGKSKKALDVDFFVGKDASGKIDVSDIKIHKVGKKERYIYDENNQIKPVPKKAKKPARRKASSKTG